MFNFYKTYHAYFITFFMLYLNRIYLTSLLINSTFVSYINVNQMPKCKFNDQKTIIIQVNYMLRYILDENLTHIS